MLKIKAITHYGILFVLLAGNIYLRLYPAFFPQLYQRAVLNVTLSSRQEIESDVDKRYPDISAVIRNKIIEQSLAKEKKSKLFKQKISQQYQLLKGQYQDEQGQTYLAEVDPYAWLRAVRFVLERGYPGTEKAGKAVYDSFILAPQGTKVQPEQFLFYSAAFLYRIVHRLASGISLTAFLFYLPLFFTLVFLISLYAFCRYFFSKTTALIALFFAGLSPALIDRSSCGWFDADVLSILWPLLIVWLLALSQQASTRKNTIIFSLCAGGVVSLYAATWVGWWFIFLVVLVYYCSLFVHTAILYHKDLAALNTALAGPVISCGSFILASIIGCVLLGGIEPFSFLWQQIGSNLGLGRVVSESIWPNVYYTVMELKPGDVFNIPELVGNWFMFVFSLASLLWLYIRQRRSQKAAVMVMFAIWILLMFFASLRGIRFGLFLVVPISIFLAEGLRCLAGFIWIKVRSSSSLWVKLSTAVAAAAAIYLLASLSLYAGLREAAMQVPMMNDSWYSFLTELRSRSEEDAIINGWWDHGNWYKEIARRRALFDPQSQNTPVTYWIARVFLADDETYALRVLRMLNNSSYRLFDEINQYFDNAFSSIVFLEKVLQADAANVDLVFSQYQLPARLQQRIKEVIFYKIPAPAYLVVYKTMIYQMSGDTFIANWDFAKVYTLQHKGRPRQEVIKGLMSIFSLSEAKASAIYDEVSRVKNTPEKNEVVSQRWLFNPSLAEGLDSGSTVYFNNGIIFEKDTLSARIFSFSEKRYNKFGSTLYFDGQQLQAKTFDDAQLTSGALIIKTENGFQSIGYLNRRLAESLFSRLLFMKAKGLKHFEPFVGNEKAGIYAFRIIWD